MVVERAIFRAERFSSGSNLVSLAHRVQSAQRLAVKLRAAVRGRSAASTALWVDRSTLDSRGKPGMIQAGHAPAGYESSTANT